MIVLGADYDAEGLEVKLGYEATGYSPPRRFQQAPRGFGLVSVQSWTAAAGNRPAKRGQRGTRGRGNEEEVLKSSSNDVDHRKEEESLWGNFLGAKKL